MSDLLSLHDVTVTARDREQPLVDRVNLKVSRNGSLVLIGQSGSGKTMLCRCIMNLLDSRELHVSGMICFDGHELLTMPSRARQKLYGRRIALIPQNPMTAFDPSQKIGTQLRETLRLHQQLSRRDADASVMEGLLATGLQDPKKVMQSYPYMLSGGMLQRCAIAVAIWLHPDLVLADEPTTALDAEHRLAVIDLLSSMRDSGTSVLLVTHDFVSAERFDGPAAVMKDGVIIERGTVEQLFCAPGSDYTKLLLEAALI